MNPNMNPHDIFDYMLEDITREFAYGLTKEQYKAIKRKLALSVLVGIMDSNAGTIASDYLNETCLETDH